MDFSRVGAVEADGGVTGGDALQAPLAMYPFGIKEKPQRNFLSDVPFRRFRLPGPRVRQ